MKKLILSIGLVVAGLSALAADRHTAPSRSSYTRNYSGGSHSSSSWNSSSGYHWNGHSSGGSYHYPHHSHSSSSFVFSFGYPYSYPYAYYPAYSSYPYPAYVSSGAPAYSYSRPNYAVGGTLLGAGIGAIIGNNVHHQTWEGAAIGAGAGLLLGGLAEHNARKREQAAYVAAPQVSYAQPNYIADAPTVPDAPRVQNNTAYWPAAGSMSAANGLFGR